MNIYGSPLCKYYDKKLLELFYVAWRKSLRRVWNISNVTHNNLLPYIHNGHPIEVILKKRCIKFVWSLFNSNYALYSNILRLSLQNGNSTMGENVRYLMHKYDIVNKILTYCIVKLNYIVIVCEILSINVQINLIHVFISDKSPYYTGCINYNHRILIIN